MSWWHLTWSGTCIHRPRLERPTRCLVCWRETQTHLVNNPKDCFTWLLCVLISTTPVKHGLDRVSTRWTTGCLISSAEPGSLFHTMKPTSNFLLAWNEGRNVLHACIYGKYNIALHSYLPTVPVNNLINSCPLNLQIPRTRNKCFHNNYLFAPQDSEKAYQTILSKFPYITPSNISSSPPTIPLTIWHLQHCYDFNLALYIFMLSLIQIFLPTFEPSTWLLRLIYMSVCLSVRPSVLYCNVRLL